ncbi:DMT family transporter [Vibrio sinensis]|uniref:DMT family transporter n=2 Tax=Vibrio sinensis TaxID=2302434 RepID=A0A3A6QTU5_9VIBR|nr:DMT family transporter [Vibrio sinensis]
MDSKIWVMLGLLSMLWGGSFFFVGVAVNELPPLTIVTLRVALAALTLWGIAFAIGLRPPQSINVWGAFFGMGLLNNVVPFILIVWGQTQIASGLASILNAATPIFAVVVAGLLLPDERPTPLKLFGVILGFIGVVVMIGVPALDGESKLLAQLAIIMATISYAFAGVYGRRFRTLGINPVITAAGQVTASTVILIPITFYAEGVIDVSSISSITWAAIAALAIVSTAVAYVLYFKILERAGATNVLLVTLLVPVSAVLLGLLFLNESLQLIHLIGMGLIALGLLAIDGRLWLRLKSALV